MNPLQALADQLRDEDTPISPYVVDPAEPPACSATLTGGRRVRASSSRPSARATSFTTTSPASSPATTPTSPCSPATTSTPSASTASLPSATPAPSPSSPT